MPFRYPSLPCVPPPSPPPRARRARAALLGVVLALLLGALLAACGGAGAGGKDGSDKDPPAGGGSIALNGRIVVPDEFLAGTDRAALMAAARVWLVDADGAFVASTAPDATGAFDLEAVPAGVAGQRLLALFGSGDDAASLEAALGALPAATKEMPRVTVDVTLGTTLQAELLRDPALAAEVRADALAGLPAAQRARLAPLALEPLDADAARMITFVGDASSNADDPAAAELRALQQGCVWWNPLSWGDCLGGSSLQVQNGGRTGATVRRPPLPADHALGLRFQDPRTVDLIAAGGGNLIAAGGGNLIAAGGGNLIAAGGGNLIAAGGGNLISAGGLNLRAQAQPQRLRVPFGYVLEPGEIGEVERLGARFDSPFVIVPKDLFERYTAEEVAFIARGQRENGLRGMEAAERIVAGMRARREAAEEVQARFRRAAAAPPATLASEARRHASPPLVYAHTQAGREALSAPRIVSLATPAGEPEVVEGVGRNLQPGMRAFWRRADGGFDAGDLDDLGGGRWRAARPAGEHAFLMLAMPGPAAPHSNLVRLPERAGEVARGAVEVQGAEGIGGQSGGVLFEDGGGTLFMGANDLVLRWQVETASWRPLTAGLDLPDADASHTYGGRLLALGAAPDGALLALYEGQAYELDASGVWRPHGPALHPSGPCAPCPPFAWAGAVLADGSVMQVDMAFSTTLTVQVLAPGGSSWRETLQDSAQRWSDWPRVDPDGTLYLIGSRDGNSNDVMRHAPGDPALRTIFSQATMGARPIGLALDPAGTVYVSAEADADASPRVFQRRSGQQTWERLPDPPAGASGDGVARPRADGPLALADGERLWLIDPGADAWRDGTDAAFERTTAWGTTFPLVQSVAAGQNGSLFAVAHERLFRRVRPGDPWEDLSRGLADIGGPVVFADDERLLGRRMGDGVYVLPDGATEWREEAIPGGSGGSAFGPTVRSALAHDDASHRAYLLTQDTGGGYDAPWTLYRRQAGAWVRLAELPADPQSGGAPALGFAPDGSVHALVGVRVYRLDGASWTVLGDALPSTALSALVATADGAVVVAGSDANAYRLAPGATSWESICCLAPGPNLGRLLRGPDDALYTHKRWDGVWRLPPGGDAWESVEYDLPEWSGYVPVAGLAVDGTGALFAGLPEGVYRLAPGASSWQPLPELEKLRDAALGIGPDNRLYASSGADGVFVSLP